MNRLRVLLQITAVAGALLFSGYGYTESHTQKKSSAVEQPSQKQASGKANQIFSFKGIPMGKPGAIGALRKICMEKKFNSMGDRCSFTSKSSMILLNYETLVDALALVTLSGDEALIRVAIDGSTEEMLALAKALEKKYGMPLKKESKVKVEIGTEIEKGTFVVKEAEDKQLDKETFTWFDDQGSRITIESIYSDFDKGGIVIESAAPNAAEKTAK